MLEGYVTQFRPTAVAIVAALAVPLLASAQVAPKSALSEENPALLKVSSKLLRARQLGAAGRTAAGITSAVPGVRITDELAVIEVRLEELTPQILDLMRGRGMLIDSFDLGYALAYGRVDLDNLDELAALPAVSTIQPMPRVGTRKGSVTGQGDASINADDGRSLFGVDGTGATVGLISDSFNDGLGGTTSGGTCTCSTPGSTCSNLVTGMANQGTGDLPASIPVLDDCTAGAPNCSVLSDEGAALGEIVSDLAPGADLMFHSAFNSPADFAGGITELAYCGADVIVDDVFWTGQPFFQDGEIAQAAQMAVDGGVAYFSAAGNDATFGVDDFFADAGAPDNELLLPNGDDFHDFGGGDTFAAITLPNNCNIFAELQWSEPFDGTLGPGAASDLDLYFLSSAMDPAATGGANILDSSTTAQGCPSGGNPTENVSYTNTTGGSDTVFLAVDHFCGDESLELRIVTISFNCGTTLAGWDFEDGEAGETAIFVDSQIFGHPAAKGVSAVAAAFYGEIDSGGTVDSPPNQFDVQPFSSLGGDLPFYFDGSGSPLPPGGSPPETRFKPEITAPDGANTTFFGVDIEFDGDTFPNFFGTSAAAPHAAAVAALMQELGNLTPAGLNQVIEQSSVDFEGPGIDDLSGFGLIDALNGIGTTVPSSASCFVDDLDLEGKPNTGAQTLRACNTLKVGNGDFTDVTGIADEIIFADGFESGDTSAWSSAVP